MEYVSPYYVYVMLETIREAFDPDGDGIFDGYSESVEFATAEHFYRDFLTSDFNKCEDDEHSEIHNYVDSLKKRQVREVVEDNA